jgi:hypothetical protein
MGTAQTAFIQGAAAHVNMIEWRRNNITYCITPGGSFNLVKGKKYSDAELDKAFPIPSIRKARNKQLDGRTSWYD